MRHHNESDDKSAIITGGSMAEAQVPSTDGYRDIDHLLSGGVVEISVIRELVSHGSES